MKREEQFWGSFAPFYSGERRLEREGLKREKSGERRLKEREIWREKAWPSLSFWAKI
jgi:hypothetical protein